MVSDDVKILKIQNELHAIAAEGAMDNAGYYLNDCMENLSYGKFEQPIRGKLNKYINLAKNYEKRSGSPFSAYAINAKESKRLADKKQAESELRNIYKKLNELNDQCDESHSKISKIIGGSRMNQKSNQDRNLNLSVTGGTAQINVAYDNAKVEATQYVISEHARLSELLNNVRGAIPPNLLPEEAESINTNLEALEENITAKSPSKKIINATLSSLKAIKGTLEFAVAIAALTEFIKSILPHII